MAKKIIECRFFKNCQITNIWEKYSTEIFGKNILQKLHYFLKLSSGFIFWRNIRHKYSTYKGHSTNLIFMWNILMEYF